MHVPLLQLLLFFTLHCTETCGGIADFALSLTPFMDVIIKRAEGQGLNKKNFEFFLLGKYM